jgi:hypothetical protein
MERAAGFVHDDTAKGKLDKLDAVLAQTSTRIEDAALFAEMLSLANDGRYPALELTPEQRRQRTLEALVSQMEALTRRNPMLMIFEDAHWTDPTTLELFGRVVDRVRSLRVLLIVTFRPDFDPPWVGRAYVTFLAINRLGEREILAMIEGVIGNKVAASFGHPAGNVAGLAAMGAEIVSKSLDLVRAILPNLNRFGILVNPLLGSSRTALVNLRASAEKVGMTVLVWEAHTPQEIETAFNAMRQTNNLGQFF